MMMMMMMMSRKVTKDVLFSCMQIMRRAASGPEFEVQCATGKYPVLTGASTRRRVPYSTENQHLFLIVTFVICRWSE